MKQHQVTQLFKKWVIHEGSVHLSKEKRFISHPLPPQKDLFLSTILNTEPSKTSKADKNAVLTRKWQLITDYNKYIGGVHKNDVKVVFVKHESG